MSEIEEIQRELDEDRMRENSNEIDDGSFETWVCDNINDLRENFMKEMFDEKSDEFKEYCKQMWNELNSGGI